MRLLKRIGITLAGILLGIIGGIALAALLEFLAVWERIKEKK